MGARSLEGGLCPITIVLGLLIIGAAFRHVDGQCENVPSEPNASPEAGAGSTNYTTGDTITYTCSPMFQVLNGSMADQNYTRECLADGTWGAASPAGCTGIRCLSGPPAQTNAGVMVITGAMGSTYNLNALAQVTCNANFQVSPGTVFYTLLCLSVSDYEAGWTANPAGASCSPIQCGSPNAVANAMTSENGTEFDIGANLTYTCDEGYVAQVGSTTNEDTFVRTCELVGNAGTWSTVSCIALTCPSLPMVLNTTTDPSSGTNLAYNTSVTVTCDAGYGVSNEVNNYTSLCDEDSTTHKGEWTNLMNCSDVNECTSTALKHDCVSPATCTNTDGSFTCSCPANKYMLSADMKSCEDVNECLASPNPCGTTTCYNTVGSFSCPCNQNQDPTGMKSIIQFELGLGSNLIPSTLTAVQLAAVMDMLSRTLNTTLMGVDDADGTVICSLSNGASARFSLLLSMPKSVEERANISAQVKDLVLAITMIPLNGVDVAVQGLKVNTLDGYRPVLDSCTFIAGNRICQNGGSCIQNSGGLPSCSCPNWSTGTYCETKNGLSPLDLGLISMGCVLFVLLVILIIVAFCCCYGGTCVCCEENKEYDEERQAVRGQSYNRTTPIEKIQPYPNGEYYAQGYQPKPPFYAGYYPTDGGKEEDSESYSTEDTYPKRDRYPREDRYRRDRPQSRYPRDSRHHPEDRYPRPDKRYPNEGRYLVRPYRPYPGPLPARKYPGGLYPPVPPSAFMVAPNYYY